VDEYLQEPSLVWVSAIQSVVDQQAGMDDGIVLHKTKASQERYNYAVQILSRCHLMALCS
jgi:hypothetical protein